MNYKATINVLHDFLVEIATNENNKKNGVTQESIANKIGKTKQYVNKVINIKEGSAMPKMQTIIELIEAYGYRTEITVNFKELNHKSL